MGRCHGGRECELNVKRQENGADTSPSSFPLGSSALRSRRSCKGQCSGLDELYEAAVAPSSPGTKLQARSALSSVTSWEKFTLSAPLHPRLSAQAPTRMPGCARCVGGVDQADAAIPGWKCIENLLGHFESTRQKTLRWVTDSD